MDPRLFVSYSLCSVAVFVTDFDLAQRHFCLITREESQNTHTHTHNKLSLAETCPPSFYFPISVLSFHTHLPVLPEFRSLLREFGVFKWISC